MAGMLLLTIIGLRAQAQCPATTYSVGSGVGIPNLSGAPTGVANLTGAQSIKITGTFTVDAGTWNISGAIVYFETNTSEIVVNSGTTLNASSGAIFQPCNAPNNWLAIRVLAGGTILADNCDFYYGANAVNIMGTATFHLTNNRFGYCGTGLRISGTQNPANHTVAFNNFEDSGSAGIFFVGKDVTIGYNTYSYSGAAPSSIGILINAGRNLKVIDGGNMVNLNRGVEIQPVQGTSCIDIQKLVFSGNTGVYSQQGQYRLNIQDCFIRAAKTGIDIREHFTGQSPPLSFGCNGNISILRNFVSSATETCIRVVAVNGNGTVTISGNSINTEINSTTAFNYYGIEVFQAPNTRIVVESNTITNQGNLGSPNHPGAIYLNNCKRENTISGNTITAAQFGGLGALKFGITAANSPHLLVQNNSVDGGPNTAERAISIENPNTDIDLCCNIMTRTNRGLYMLGAHEDCIIQTSIFGTHTEALYYDMVVSINGSPQSHRGNNWSGASATWDGYFNGNPFFAPNLAYVVNPTLLPNGLSQIFVTGGNPSDWFSTPSGTELNCNSVCGNGFAEGDGEEEELTGNDYWAINPLADTTYAAIHWGAQRYLYEKLLANPALLDDPQASDFFNAAQNGNIGKFHTIETGIANLYDPEITTDPAQKLTELQALNASITPECDYQYFEKSINTLYLAALADNDWDFSEPEKATIDDIAARCPQEAGNAVYIARFLQENYRIPDWNMDCAFVGERTKKKINPVESNFVIFPNPSNNAVTIGFGKTLSSTGRIEILSMAGQILSTRIVPEGSFELTIPTGNLPNGQYLIRYIAEGQMPFFKKIAVIH